ncbi:MAG: hypothetical protein PHF21_01730 [Bacilli bacterium]|nr:hypothetical protein [Bacilli bacterium]
MNVDNSKLQEDLVLSFSIFPRKIMLIVLINITEKNKIILLDDTNFKSKKLFGFIIIEKNPAIKKN